jgi:phosphate transport system protein
MSCPLPGRNRLEETTMSSHLERDLAHLKQQVLAMGGLVEQSLEQACAALTRRDETCAHKAVKVDEEIDRLQLDLDDFCLKILALGV